MADLLLPDQAVREIYQQMRWLRGARQALDHLLQQRGGLRGYVVEGSPLTPFALKDDILGNNGSGANAIILVPGAGDTDDWEESTAAGNYITVFSQLLGPLFAYGDAHGVVGDGPETFKGARGFCMAAADGTQQIVRCQRLATLVRGNGPTTAVAAGAVFTLSSVVACSSGDDTQLPIAVGGSTMPVTNWSLALDANATGIVALLIPGDTPTWIVIDAPCPTS